MRIKGKSFEIIKEKHGNLYNLEIIPSNEATGLNSTIECQVYGIGKGMEHSTRWRFRLQLIQAFLFELTAIINICYNHRHDSRQFWQVWYLRLNNALARLMINL